jgi:hypothetical protein
VDKHGLTQANFKNLVHRGDQITDKPYVLTSQVKQVFTSRMTGTPIGLTLRGPNQEMCKMLVRVKGLMTTKKTTTRASLSSWIIIIIMIHMRRT